MASQKYDRQLAIQMRLHGSTYKEIALVLGCSVAWCKKELVGIEPGKVKVDPVKTEVKAQVVDILQKALRDIRAL